MPKKNQKRQLNNLRSSADYFEPLLRARYVRAMKTLQGRLSVDFLATLIANNPDQVITREVLDDALKPLVKIVTDAFNRGGRHGMEHLEDVL